MAQLQEQARRTGLADRLHLIGPVGNISDWYARANLFVLSSRYEGIPNVLLEALAAGCTCLATDCPTGPRELIEHGVNGLLVPAGSVESLATGLDQLMANPAQRIALAARAPEIRHRFAADDVLQRWCEVLGV
jgi:glycosyltransferase involved in cell wall biosynthesis